MSNGNGHRWSKFWWQDYLNDRELKLCSLAAQGLWMRMLCVMHDADGYLLVAGRLPSGRNLATILSVSERQIGRLVEELLQHNVARKTNDGVIYCQRMVNDIKASAVGKTAASKRWNGHAPTGSPTSPTTSPPTSPPTREPINPRSLEAKKLEAKKESSPPPTPAPRGAGREIDPPLFDEFWERYPRKVGRRRAAQAFHAAVRRGHPAQEILAGLARHAFNDNPQFIPHPSTWLAADRWRDEADTFDPVLRAAGLSPEDFDHDERVWRLQ